MLLSSSSEWSTSSDETSPAESSPPRKYKGKGKGVGKSSAAVTAAKKPEKKGAEKNEENREPEGREWGTTMNAPFRLDGEPVRNLSASMESLSMEQERELLNIQGALTEEQLALPGQEEVDRLLGEKGEKEDKEK